MVSLGDSGVNMFQHEDFDLFPSSHHNGSLYTDMLQTRQDSMFTIPTSQPFEHSLEEQYSSATMTSYESYPPASPYFSVPRSFYDQPQFVVNAPQDISKPQQFFVPTPAVSPAHSTSNSFDPPPSALSSASGASVPSAPSSSMGSPYSGAHMLQGHDSWAESNQGLGIRPSIIHSDSFSGESFVTVGLDHGSIYAPHDKIQSGFVDPSLISPFQSIPTTLPMQQDMPLFHSPQITQFHPHPPSPAPSNSSIRSTRPGSANMRTGSHSPYLHTVSYQPYPQYSPHSRRPSTSSARSHISAPTSQRGSPGASSVDDETREKGKCMECGKVFKDLKAHMLTHLHERPEKCPIVTCEYHQKGFARKYDKNRHTLTHYKGTMVCGFCPGSGSAAEKSFNRADVFKRHLTSVHNVEQAPPNSRKKASSANSANKFPTYAADATGKCSTCAGTFSNAQDFYEHLDECVLRVVQQEDPSAAINERNIASVNDDEAVQQTMRANALPLHTNYADQEENYDEDEEEVEEEEEDYEKDDEKDESWKASGGNAASGRTPSTRARSGTVKRSGSGSGALSKPNQAAQPNNARGCISKVRRSGSGGRAGTFTFSKGGVPVVSKSKKRRKNYPPSWGCSTDKMTMKKRGLYVFDGPRRLWKDDMMLSNEFEVRINLNDGKYFTDLDDLTVKRAEAIHDATEEEKGPWQDDDINIKELMS